LIKALIICFALSQLNEDAAMEDRGLGSSGSKRMKVRMETLEDLK